jgi:hypothetical protein
VSSRWSSHRRGTRRALVASALALVAAAALIVVLGPNSGMFGTGGPVPSTPVSTAGPPGPARERPEPVETGPAQAAVAAASATAQPGSELALAVLDRATGELALGARAAEPYYTASLSKLVLAIDMLTRRRLEGLGVTADDLRLLGRALGPSDDTAMNQLWVAFDGPGAAGRLSARLGLTATTAPADTSQWGQMRVSAPDWMRIWRHLLDEMPAADRELILGAMAAAPPIAADGFDQAFGLLAPGLDGPPGPGAVAKQGWMCCVSGGYYLHSVGVVGDTQRFVVALLLRLPGRPGWESARAEMTAIAEATSRALAS